MVIETPLILLTLKMTSKELQGCLQGCVWASRYLPCKHLQGAQNEKLITDTRDLD